MKNRLVTQLLATSLCASLAACVSSKLEPVASPLKVPSGPTTLRVALFPYIPDSGGDRYASLMQFIESRFERQYPSIDLTLRQLDQNDDFYDLPTLANWLSPSATDGYDLVEVDTVLLGDLVGAGLVAPWYSPPSPTDWHPVASQSVRLNGVFYGVPHLLCGHFLMTRDSSVAQAGNVTELASALRAIPNKHPDLVANLLGSWNLPSLYLDAWEDENRGYSTALALHRPLDEKALAAFKQFSSLCVSGGVNPCLDGTYDSDPDLAAARFARGEADSLVGYSERLHLVLSAAADPSKILLTPAPMGNGKYPVLFTDALVLRREAPSNVNDAARLFAAFMNSREVQEAVVTSGDVSRKVPPRYLIPATQSAFGAPRVKTDRFFRAINQSIKSAVPFPNVGFLNTRKAVRDAVKQYLDKP